MSEIIDEIDLQVLKKKLKNWENKLLSVLKHLSNIVASSEEEKRFFEQCSETVKILNKNNQKNNKSKLKELENNKKSREKAKNLLKTMLTFSNSEKYITEIENKVFEKYKEANQKYRDDIRLIGSSLQKNKEIVDKLLQAQLTTSDIAECKFELLQTEKDKKELDQIEKKCFNERRNDIMLENNNNVAGLANCPNCNSTKTNQYYLQIKGYAQPQTQFIECFDCRQTTSDYLD